MEMPDTPSAGCETARPDSAERPAECSGGQGWEQQPGEPERAYRMLRVYLQLGRKRSIHAARDAAIQAGVPGVPGISAVCHMSGQWHWHERAKAWDIASIDQEAVRALKPWDQQMGESEREFRVFQIYLQLGAKRTYPAAGRAAREEDGAGAVPTPYAMKEIGAKWSWRARAKAWDEAHPRAAAAVDPKPWEQLSYEGDSAYAIFKHYLALGQFRTVRQAVDVAVKEDGCALALATAAYYATWCHWRERAEAWDAEQFAAEFEGEAGQAQELADGGAEEANQDRQPWERQPGEPPRMYSLFCHYLELGPTRSIARVYRDCEVVYAGLPKPHANYQLVNRWRWLERAAAWDAHQRDQLAERINNLRAALEEQRLSIAEIWFDQAVDAFQTANLADLDEATARRMMPIIHRMMVDAGAIQRMELDIMAKRGAAVQNQGQVTAETMYAYSEMLAKAKAAEAAKQAAADAGPAGLIVVDGRNVQPATRTLLVCTGPDPELARDEAALRAVTNLQLLPLGELTQSNLEDKLRRERSLGRPVKLMHMAVHASREGVQFADGLVDGAWLSRQLSGVEVLVLAGCDTEHLGDWLHVVRYVVTVADKISHGDAAVLSEAFWLGIGNGCHPTDALNAALDKSPRFLRELVTRHW